jgi:cytidylate kinase
MVKNVILISGKLRSGKNTLTDMIMEELKNTKCSVGFDFFAKSVKDQSKDIFRNLIEYLNEVSEKYDVPELKTTDDNWYEHKNKITRIILQTYGTDIFRDMIDTDHWSKILKRRLTEKTEDFMFITDVRFKSEISVISDKTSFKHDRRTITPKYNIFKIRINRNTYERSDDPIFTHPSEMDLDDYTNWDLVVNNDGTLEDLMKQAKHITSFILENSSNKFEKTC